MLYKIKVILCHKYKAEALAALRDLSIKGIRIHIATFNSPCGCTAPNLAKTIQESVRDCDSAILLGGACLRSIQNTIEAPIPILFKIFDQCNYMFANKELLTYFNKEKTYIITTGFLCNWKQNLNQDAIGRNFKRLFQQILLLDTGTASNSEILLKETADFLQVPYKSIPIGLDYFTLLLKNEIMQQYNLLTQAEFKNQIKKSKRKNSNYALVFNEISKLTQITLEEEEIIKKSLELYERLITSDKLLYASYNNGSFYKLTSQRAAIMTKEKTAWYKKHLNESFAINSAGNGFMIPVIFKDEILGVLEVEGLHCVKQINYYIHFSKSLSSVLALALYNARTYLSLERTKNHLKLSESKNTAILNTIPDMLILVDPEGNILTCKPQHLYFSYTLQYKLYNTIYDIFPYDIAEQMKSFITKAVKTGEPQYFMYELPIHERRYAYECRIAATNHNEILLILRDINDLVKMQKDFTRLENLNLIGEMAASIGHEVRNPMTTVRGFLQFIEKRPDFLKYKDRFELMISELDRANAIITDFLSLAKNKAIEPEIKNLNHIVEAMLPLLHANAIISGYTITLQLNDIPPIWVDEKEIRQLILNLCHNGLEAMQPGGKLIIRTYKDNNDIVLSIKDHGSGISQEILERIGIPFFTTKENGTGLGLAVCYSIALRHNAKIEFSTNSGGTTVYVKFSEASR